MARLQYVSPALALWLALVSPALGQISPVVGRFPADKAMNVNPDTHLVLTFPSPPTLGNAGQIRIYDAGDNRLVDTLDLSVPPNQQNNVIGGFKEGFHFYPVIINDRTAAIYPHNNKLEYKKTYYVQIDPGVLRAGFDFDGIAGNAWTFSTKSSPPAAGTERLVVSADGTGDFNTVQGAADFIPDKGEKRVTVFIKNGTYEEIVYFRNKANITFLGESRDKVVICAKNSEAFNGQAAGTRTNELPETFSYRRVAFMADHSSGIHVVNLSLKNLWGMGSQAEALLMMGGKNIVSHVNLYGNTDTLQFNDSVYITDSYIEGGGDFLWGRGPAFFNRCDIKELGNNPMMWIRSTAASHGFVYLDCKFAAPNATGAGPVLARNTTAYPNSEVVLLNCALGPVNPVGFTIPGATAAMHYWEYNSTNIADGKAADVSRRAAGSRQLTMENDGQTIKDYSNPGFVLGGWVPAMGPVVLSGPVGVSAEAGKPVVLSVVVAGVPVPALQWMRDGKVIGGATGATLKIDAATAPDAGAYTISATNSSGTTSSAPVMVAFK